MLVYETIIEQLLERFPQIEIDEISEDLPHCVYGNCFVPFIKDHLIRSSSDVDEIFDFLEEMATSQDKEVQNLLQVSVLESLADDAGIRATAKKHMQEETYRIYLSLSAYMRNI